MITVRDVVYSFVNRITNPFLTEQQRQEAWDVLTKLTSRSMPQYLEGRPGRSGMCTDGCPMEFSLAFDELGNTEFRYVIDAGDVTIPVLERTPTYREFADAAVPNAKGHAALLDFLFDRHLDGMPANYLFRVWHGAGFAADKPRTGKLYFNTEWMPPARLRELTTTVFKDKWLEDSLELLALTDGLHLLGYEFNSSGITRLKAYSRWSWLDSQKIQDRAQQLLGVPSNDLAHVIERISPFMGEHAHKPCIVVFSVQQASNQRQLTVYLPLEAWGASSPRVIAAVIEELLGFSVNAPFAGEDRLTGIVPTVLSFRAAGQQRRAALYFRPDLGNALPVVA
jgi:hypothetical protein